MTQYSLDKLTYQINAAAIEVHRTLGPGLLESIYQKCLAHELSIRGIAFKTEVIVPITYKGMDLQAAIRCDFVVEGGIVIETKAIEELHSIHHAQLLTYMNQLRAPKGTLYNFNCINLIQYGQKTFVNKLYGALPKE